MGNIDEENVNVNEQLQAAQVVNNVNERSVLDKATDMVTNKYALIGFGTLATVTVAAAIWKWGIPAFRKVFGKKQQEPATDKN